MKRLLQIIFLNFFIIMSLLLGSCSKEKVWVSSFTASESKLNLDWFLNDKSDTYPIKLFKNDLNSYFISYYNEEEEISYLTAIDDTGKTLYTKKSEVSFYRIENNSNYDNFKIYIDLISSNNGYTTKYKLDGSQNWIEEGHLEKKYLTQNNNTIITLRLYGMYNTHKLIKVDQSGNIVWTYLFNNESYSFGPNIFYEDASENIYYYENKGDAPYVGKIDATGNLKWEIKLNYFTDHEIFDNYLFFRGPDIDNLICYDSDGNIIYEKVEGTFYDIYSKNGKLIYQDTRNDFTINVLDQKGNIIYKSEKYDSSLLHKSLLADDGVIFFVKQNNKIYSLKVNFEGEVVFKNQVSFFTNKFQPIISKDQGIIFLDKLRSISKMDKNGNILFDLEIPYDNSDYLRYVEAKNGNIIVMYINDKYESNGTFVFQEIDNDGIIVKNYTIPNDFRHGIRELKVMANGDIVLVKADASKDSNYNLIVMDSKGNMKYNKQLIAYCKTENEIIYYTKNKNSLEKVELIEEVETYFINGLN